MQNSFFAKTPVVSFSSRVNCTAKHLSQKNLDFFKRAFCVCQLQQTSAIDFSDLFTFKLTRCPGTQQSAGMFTHSRNLFQNLNGWKQSPVLFTATKHKSPFDGSYFWNNIIRTLGGSPGLEVMQGDSHSQGRGFKPCHHILDGHFFT